MSDSVPGFGSGSSGSYELYTRGCDLLERGSWHAACEVLSRARDAEPEKTSIREALGRALFRSRRFEEAAAEFAHAVELNPADDYSHFGLGLSYERIGERVAARRHLRLACAMAPGREHYQRALEQALDHPEEP